ncbi:hypothetical protein AUI46_01510 [archaeon 13_1_40CM_2_52_13]|nr:MAG: hypothetical protein AUI46_01510 [archaeon 13_1_40CM_2_52_13]OLE68446.1 MAG: hypothetical protein AUF78_15935 [archaeon 13_1_20CM_2_51_12]
MRSLRVSQRLKLIEFTGNEHGLLLVSMNAPLETIAFSPVPVFLSQLRSSVAPELHQIFVKQA